MKIWPRLLQVFLVLVLLAPVVAVAMLSLSPSYGMDVFTRRTLSDRWWIALSTDPAWVTALANSFLIAAISAAGSLIVTLPATTVWRFTGSRFLYGSLLASGLSFAIPPIVLAVGLYQLLVRISLFDTLLGIAAAHLAFTIPVSAFVLAARFRNTAIDVYLAARSLGAGPFAAALRWLLGTQKATLAGCLAAGILASLSEVTVTIYVTDSRVSTIARRALAGVTHDIQPTGFAFMAAWILVMWIFISVGSRWNARIARGRT
jgi:ABC-type spermidine/putrescine transport system permease subunit II